MLLETRNIPTKVCPVRPCAIIVKSQRVFSVMNWNERYPNFALKANHPGDEYGFACALRAKTVLFEIATRNEPLPDAFYSLTNAVAHALAVDFVEVLEDFDDCFHVRLWHRFAGHTDEDFSEDKPKLDSKVSRESYAGYALDQARSLNFADYEAEKRFKLPFHPAAYRVKSGLATPIKVGGRTWGVLAVHHYKPIRFLEEEISYLEEAGLSRIERVAIASADQIDSPGRYTARIPRRRPFNANELHGTPRVLQTGRAEVVEDVPSSSKDEHLKLVKHLNGRSYICIPLSVGRTQVGSMCFVVTSDDQTRGRADIEGAKMLAAVLALGLRGKLRKEAGYEPKDET